MRFWNPLESSFCKAILSYSLAVGIFGKELQNTAEFRAEYPFILGDIWVWKFRPPFSPFHAYSHCGSIILASKVIYHLKDSVSLLVYHN